MASYSKKLWWSSTKWDCFFPEFNQEGVGKEIYSPKAFILKI
jgi:hypothetical protein